MTTRFLAGLMALAFCFIMALPAYAQSDPTPEKKALTKELLGLLNSGNAAESIAIQFLEQFQQSGIILIKSDLREWIQAQKFAPAEKNAWRLKWMSQLNAF